MAIVRMTIDIKDQPKNACSSSLQVANIAMWIVTAWIANSLNISNLFSSLDSRTFCLAINMDARRLSMAIITN